MAVYGVDLRNGNPHNGLIGFSGWTPSLGFGSPQLGGGSAAGAVQFNGQSQNDDRISKAFRKSGYGLKLLRTIFSNQIGQAVGAGSGQVLYKQVRGQTGDSYASNRPIEQLAFQNRATTAADIAAFRGMINRAVAPVTYPKDVSGNGGGGKVKF